MILDTSALLAILLREPEAASFAAALETAETVRLSAASYLEAAIFVDRHGDEVRRALLDTFSRNSPSAWSQLRWNRHASPGRHSNGSAKVFIRPL